MALKDEGINVQFVVLSDTGADFFTERTEFPIFEDAGQGQPAWDLMEENARKEDTFIYSKTGERLLFWDLSSENRTNWTADVRAVIEANQ